MDCPASGVASCYNETGTEVQTGELYHGLWFEDANCPSCGDEIVQHEDLGTGPYGEECDSGLPRVSGDVGKCDEYCQREGDDFFWSDSSGGSPIGSAAVSRSTAIYMTLHATYRYTGTDEFQVYDSDNNEVGSAILESETSSPTYVEQWANINIPESSDNEEYYFVINNQRSEPLTILAVSGEGTDDYEFFTASLEFFSWFNMLVTVIVIGLIYYAWNAKMIRKGKRKH